MEAQGWSLDELVAEVAAVLSDGHAGQPSRRVRAVPDRRAIRWYTTIGLLDRPRLRGRTGWYGRRHLLQLLAIKRLQAAGKPLAQIQAELAGATDARLREIAGLSDDHLARVPAARGVDGADAAGRPRFWATAPARARARDGAELRYAVPLADGVTLLLDAPPAVSPDGEDLSAVRAAARPLLDQLARLGLIRAVPEEDS